MVVSWLILGYHLSPFLAWWCDGDLPKPSTGYSRGEVVVVSPLSNIKVELLREGPSALYPFSGKLFPMKLNSGKTLSLY